MRAYISIGSNQDTDTNVRAAIAALRAQFGSVPCSGIYETPAVGFSGAPFLNLVCAIDTPRTLEDVQAALRAIESALGRHRGEQKFAPRTIDLDLLTWGNVVAGRIPRDDITQYDFVLGPLAELAGDERHPVLKRTYGELWAEMASRGYALTPVAPARATRILET